MADDPKILIASDHAGFELKQAIQKLLPQWQWIDLGPKDASRVDYPDYAEKLCQKLLEGQASQGVLICGSGIGMSIAANKFRGIRAAVAENPISALLAREHNNANVLCLGGRFLAPDYASEVVRAWMHGRFDPSAGSGRHQGRIDKISRIESR